MKIVPMMAWSRRDLGRRPALAVLLFLALSTVTALVAAVLILHHAVVRTFDGLLDHSPAMVVRRVDGGGWMPMPVAPALSAVRSVPGAIRPRTRIWGVVAAGDVPVTIVGVEKVHGFGLPGGVEVPTPGQAWLGTGVKWPDKGQELTLTGRQTVIFGVSGRLPESAAMAVHDLVVLHADDARRLLGLKPGQASDLVLDVFHDQEADSLARELSKAFPWPVQITTRHAVRTAYATHFAARGTAGLLGFIPALLALVLLIAALGVWGFRGRPDMGLMKAMGWTSGDLLRLHLTRAVLVGLPAFAAGLLGAWAVSFFPGGKWLTRLLFDWSGPTLALSPQGAIGPLALAAAVVFLPYLVASFWSGWQTVQADPMELIQGRGQ